MAHDVCPWWMGYLLASPIRRLMENPDKMMAGLVEPGMRVLEPGSGMGFFTLPLARMVGPQGRVIALDLQERMLQGLRRRAAKAGVEEWVETRRVTQHSLDIPDLKSSMDLALALYLVHELPDQAAFFNDVHECLKPGGRLLIIEPRQHVPEAEMLASVELARDSGFGLVERQKSWGGRHALMQKAA